MFRNLAQWSQRDSCKSMNQADSDKLHGSDMGLGHNNQFLEIRLTAPKSKCEILQQQRTYVTHFTSKAYSTGTCKTHDVWIARAAIQAWLRCAVVDFFSGKTFLNSEVDMLFLK